MEQPNNGPITDEEFGEFLTGEDPLQEAVRKAQGALMSNRSGEHQGVLRYTLAAHGNKDYRQELKLALFASADEADEAVSAITESCVLGMDPTPIIDQIVARSADVKHGFLSRVLNALTHQSHAIYTNYDKRMKSSDGNQPKGGSPF